MEGTSRDTSEVSVVNGKIQLKGAGVSSRRKAAAKRKAKTRKPRARKSRAKGPTAARAQAIKDREILEAQERAQAETPEALAESHEQTVHLEPESLAESASNAVANEAGGIAGMAAGSAARGAVQFVGQAVGVPDPILNNLSEEARKLAKSATGKKVRDMVKNASALTIGSTIRRALNLVKAQTGETNYKILMKLLAMVAGAAMTSFAVGHSVERFLGPRPSPFGHIPDSVNTAMDPAGRNGSTETGHSILELAGQFADAGRISKAAMDAFRAYHMGGHGLSPSDVRMGVTSFRLTGRGVTPLVQQGMWRAPKAKRALATAEILKRVAAEASTPGRPAELDGVGEGAAVEARRRTGPDNVGVRGMLAPAMDTAGASLDAHHADNPLGDQIPTGALLPPVAEAVVNDITGEAREQETREALEAATQPTAASVGAPVKHLLETGRPAIDPDGIVQMLRNRGAKPLPVATRTIPIVSEVGPAEAIVRSQILARLINEDEVRQASIRSPGVARRAPIDARGVGATFGAQHAAEPDVLWQRSETQAERDVRSGLGPKKSGLQKTAAVAKGAAAGLTTAATIAAAGGGNPISDIVGAVAGLAVGISQAVAGTTRNRQVAETAQAVSDIGTAGAAIASAGAATVREAGAIGARAGAAAGAVAGAGRAAAGAARRAGGAVAGALEPAPTIPPEGIQRPIRRRDRTIPVGTPTDSAVTQAAEAVTGAGRAAAGAARRAGGAVAGALQPAPTIPPEGIQRPIRRRARPGPEPISPEDAMARAEGAMPPTGTTGVAPGGGALGGVAPGGGGPDGDLDWPIGGQPDPFGPTVPLGGPRDDDRGPPAGPAEPRRSSLAAGAKRAADALGAVGKAAGALGTAVSRRVSRAAGAVTGAGRAAAGAAGRAGGALAGAIPRPPPPEGMQRAIRRRDRPITADRGPRADWAAAPGDVADGIPRAPLEPRTSATERDLALARMGGDRETIGRAERAHRESRREARVVPDPTGNIPSRPEDIGVAASSHERTSGIAAGTSQAPESARSILERTARPTPPRTPGSQRFLERVARQVRQIADEGTLVRDPVARGRRAANLRDIAEQLERGVTPREHRDTVAATLRDMRAGEAVLGTELSPDQAIRVQGVLSDNPPDAALALARMVPGLDLASAEDAAMQALLLGQPIENGLMATLQQHIEQSGAPSAAQASRYTDAATALFQVQALRRHAARAGVPTIPGAREAQARLEARSRGKGFSIINMALRSLEGRGLHNTARAIRRGL